MKLRLLPTLFAAIVAAPAFALTATFEALTPNTAIASGYQEDGIQFSSPTAFNVVTGYHAATLFGGGYIYSGNALSVNNSGWVGISVPGNLLDSVTLRYGFDWNFNAIEYGLMDVAVEWLAMLNGNVVGAGGLQFDRDHRSHGGGQLTATSATAFDQLLLRSTAVGYQAVTSSNPWYYDRGDAIGYGDANHVAFDDVNVTLAAQRSLVAVPDDTSSLVLLAIAATGTLVALRTRRASNPVAADAERDGQE